MKDDKLTKIYLGAGILFGIAIVLVLTVFWGIISLVEYLNKPAFLDVLVTPLDAKVEINGNEYRNAVYGFEPGEYTATVTKEGFEPKTVNFELEKNKTTGLYLYLEPNDGDLNYYTQKKNVESLNALLKMHGYSEKGKQLDTNWAPIDKSESMNELIQKVALKSVTPFDFAICGTPAKRTNCDSIIVKYDYDLACENQLCLIISGRRENLTEEVKNGVQKELAEKGYNLDNYRYAYLQKED